MYSNKENVNILTALLVKYGVKHIVVCPGSRNAPLVHNFNECPDITCHPATDERSAGFIAMGLRQHVNSPVAVCVTSGSALLNVLPAAAEATYQHQGIIVISADRPQAWIGQMDGQTMPQPGAMGNFVGKSVSLPEPHDDTERWHCNRLVCEALIANLSDGYPSVHINVPITEPLFDFTVPQLPDERRISFGSWDTGVMQDYVISALENAERPMVVIGQMPDGEIADDCYDMMCDRAVVLTEQLAVAEQTFCDQMLYAIQNNPEAFRPDVVLFMGGNTVSKRLRQFLRSLDAVQIVVSMDGSISDISQNTAMVVTGNPYDVFTDLVNMLPETDNEYMDTWDALYGMIADRHDAFCPDFSSMLAVKLFEQEMSEGDIVYYGNSMPVRLGVIYANHFIHCNRGINGIEGSLSAAAGAALAAEGVLDSNVYCVIGDLSFFYDENALWQQQLSGNLRILLLNNGQGGIFRNLKGLEQSPVCDSYVAAAHTTSARGICHQFGITYLQATDTMSLQRGIIELTNMKSDRPVLLEVMTSADNDEREFKKYYKHLIK